MTKTSFSRIASSIAVAAGIAAAAPGGVALAQQPSAADISEARNLYNQGIRLRETGDMAGALEKLKGAHALAHTPITGLELGRTYEKLGQLVEAEEALLSVSRIDVVAAETARSTAARRESTHLADELRPRIPTLAVRITGAPPGSATLTIDGTAVPAEALDAPRPLDPGTHELAARSTNGGTAQATVALKEGDALQVEARIPLVAPTPMATSTVPAGEASPPPSASKGGLSPLVYVGVGLGAGGLIVGTVTGVLAMSKASTVKGSCMGTLCDPSVKGDVQSGQTLGNVSTVAFIGAGVGAALGIVGLVLSQGSHEDPKAESSFSPWIGPASAGIRGTF